MAFSGFEGEVWLRWGYFLRIFFFEVTICGLALRMALRFGFLCLLLLLQGLSAIPNTILGGFVNNPSPLDGSDLTEPLLTAVRDGAELPGNWEEEASVAGTQSAYLMARPKVFGQEALLVRGLWREGDLEEVQVTFNDAGSYFGYDTEEVPPNLKGRKREEFLRSKFEERQESFAILHEESLELAKKELASRSEKGRAKEVRFGKSRAIRAEVLEYEWEGVTARLFHGPNRLVRILLRKEDGFSDAWMDQVVAEMDKRKYAQWLLDRVEKTEIGDEVLDDLEIVPQGYRPYCGLNTLVMAGRYLGLHIDEDWMASAGKFENTGSAAGSQMLSLYGSVASEAGVKMKRVNDFDEGMVKRSLRAGLPVIVWRRWSKERDRRHSLVTRSVSAGGSSAWGELDEQALPDESSPLHASVIVGFNEERDEFLFLESWAKLNGPRRMPVQELDKTAYLTFCFQH